VVHNYLISLYIKSDDEDPLLRFIEEYKHKPFFDQKYALRLCHQEEKKRSCVAIYTSMKLYEEAVQLALEFDLDYAKFVINESAAHTEQADRKRLWLLIARKVIESNGGVSKAMAILKEKEGELRLEDILPFFPSFVRIGEFKDQICKSLELYNSSIDALKEEMKEFAQSAELIRKDINELRNRSGVVNATSKCDLCSQLVLTRQFFLFPCTHVFHVDCMIKSVSTYLDKNPRLKQEIFSAKTKKDKEKKYEKKSPSIGVSFK